MELYIVRHGQTAWNVLGKLQGINDIELNQNGIEAAINLGKRLQNIDFDAIYSSPLKRAYKTACLIRGQKEIPIITDLRLKEVSFGKMEGKTPDVWKKDELFNNLFVNPAKYVACDGAESLEDLCKRTKNFIQQEIESQFKRANRLMIVAHGALNSAITCYLENRKIDDFWGKGLLKNCQEIIYVFDGNNWTLKA